MENFLKILCLMIGSVILIGTLSLILALPFMWCWNYVIPSLFGFKTLSWLQAWCLMLVFNVLIKPTQLTKS